MNNGTKLTDTICPVIYPAATDRATIIGMTGSGKTELAIRLLLSRIYVVIHDGKDETYREKKLWRYGFHRFERLRDLVRETNRHGLPRVCYCPELKEARDERINDEFFFWIYERHNTTCYVDEIGVITSNNQIPDGLYACLSRGRSRNVELWTSTQRPKKIPESLLSEAQNFYLFALNLPQDVQRVYEITGVEPDKIRKLSRYEFYYYNKNEKQALGPMRLRLSPADQAGQ